MQCCKISCWSDAGQQEIDWQPIAATALANDADCKYLQRAIFPMENETCFFYFSFFHGKWHMFFLLLGTDVGRIYIWKSESCLFVVLIAISNWFDKKKGKLNWGNCGSNWSSQDSLTSNPE